MYACASFFVVDLLSILDLIMVSVQCIRRLLESISYSLIFFVHYAFVFYSLHCRYYLSLLDSDFVSVHSFRLFLGVICSLNYFFFISNSIAYMWQNKCICVRFTKWVIVTHWNDFKIFNGSRTTVICIIRVSSVELWSRTLLNNDFVECFDFEINEVSMFCPAYTINVNKSYYDCCALFFQNNCSLTPILSFNFFTYSSRQLTVWVTSQYGSYDSVYEHIFPPSFNTTYRRVFIFSVYFFLATWNRFIN